MNVRAGATPATPSTVRRNRAVPHCGTRSPIPDRESSRELLYIIINSPLASKGKGRK
jgi:hypothetical protein